MDLFITFIPILYAKISLLSSIILIKKIKYYILYNMSKDKKKKYQAIFQQNTPTNQVSTVIEEDELAHHRLLKSDLIKDFFLSFGIIVTFIGLFLYNNSTEKITELAEKISGLIIK